MTSGGVDCYTDDMEILRFHPFNCRLRLLLVPAVMCAMVSPAMSAPPDPAMTQQYRQLQALDVRLWSVGHRLAIANAELCQDRSTLTGAILHDRHMYDANGQAAFAFATDVAIAGVVPGSPAAQAGLRDGDGLIAVNDAAPAPEGDSADAARARLGAANDLLEQAPPDREMTLSILRDGKRFDIKLSGLAGCASRYEVSPRNSVGGSADGRFVGVTIGMMDLAQSEDALAALVAHEMAHNILHHAERLKASGGWPGLLGPLDSATGRVRETEAEADRLSIWLLANAGYDIDAGLAFWQKLSRKKGYGIFSDGTHYRWKRRLAMMQQERTLLAATQPMDGIKIPDLVRQPHKPLD